MRGERWNQGRSMAGTELEDHRAITVEGIQKADDLMFRLANGKKNQEHKWTVSCYYFGRNIRYTYTNRSYNPITGKGNFEDWLLKNYVSDELTKDGKLALVEMKKNRAKKDKKNRQNANKKQGAK